MSVTESRITKTPDVCDGDASIRDTRITVWGLVEWRRLGLTDEQILARTPGLSRSDLEAAWQYAAGHADEIERALWLNEACMVEHRGTNVPPELLRRGRELGFTDAEIRDAFEPPLAPDLPLRV